MAGQKSRSSKRSDKPGQTSIPDIYQEMLAETLPAQPGTSDRPLKRRRTGRRRSDEAKTEKLDIVEDAMGDDDDSDLEFEDVMQISKDHASSEADAESNQSRTPRKQEQTRYKDSDDDEDSGNSDADWEGVDIGMVPENAPSGDLELTLTAKAVPQVPIASRRKPSTSVEKALRLQIHKMHLLCFLSYISRRNSWCNDDEVQRNLRPLLDKKTMTLLNPKPELSQFGRAESLKRGLEAAGMMWLSKFNITKRGLRRALWADDETDLQNFPPDMDPPLEMSDFRTSAKSLKGSRDLGAQLYCALLRSAGLDVRLVCSLQPLSFNSGGPSMQKYPAQDKGKGSMDVAGEQGPSSVSSTLPSNADGQAAPLTTRQRLGHPNAADYTIPHVNLPSRSQQKSRPAAIHESQYPVYWVEVLDDAHQKWLPVDALVTKTVAKPRSLEPPILDRENSLSYVVAFDDEGFARDVTKRYAKVYNAKTRRNRLESTDRGSKWWNKALRVYSRGWKTDLEEIEDSELVAIEAREPMPKNVADFKDHPHYALERHLRRNEVLASSHVVGKVAAGRDVAGTPGTKKLENVYRRRDVKIARSADAWYRVGREVKLGELPIKTVAAKRRPEEEVGDEPDERPGTNLYSEDQTELYQAPPVVGGRIPKNSYGNLDVYVPSMVPPGGVHIKHPACSRAARLLGVDYAEALTGFEFRGRHGTAVLKGAVVAVEYQDAVEAVIKGFSDEEAREQEEMRMLMCLRMWKRFLMGLRIKQRVDGYQVEGEDGGEGGEMNEQSDEHGAVHAPPDSEEDEDMADEDSDGMKSEIYEDDGAGGFLLE